MEPAKAPDRVSGTGPRKGNKAARFVVRATLVLCALGAAALAASVLPEARAMRREELFAAKLLNGQSFARELVEAAVSRADVRRRGRERLPEGEFGVVVAASWLAEEALGGGDTGQMDERRQVATAAAIRSLRADPLQAFPWLVLFRNRVLTEGYSPELLPLLRITYRLAPRESWVAVRRIAAAAPLGDALPAEDRSRIGADLVGLMKVGQVATAVALLARPAASYRAEVTARVAEMPYPTQRIYRRLALAAGFEVEKGLTVPPKRGPRGWWPPQSPIM